MAPRASLRALEMSAFLPASTARDDLAAACLPALRRIFCCASRSAAESCLEASCTPFCFSRKWSTPIMSSFLGSICSRGWSDRLMPSRAKPPDLPTPPPFLTLALRCRSLSRFILWTKMGLMTSSGSCSSIGVMSDETKSEMTSRCRRLRSLGARILPRLDFHMQTMHNPSSTSSAPSPTMTHSGLNCTLATWHASEFDDHGDQPSELRARDDAWNLVPASSGTPAGSARSRVVRAKARPLGVGGTVALNTTSESGSPWPSRWSRTS
mmetsp:Transcript_29534/g.76258  ORF Transcript_29534/g.76258 Transcript_29534/m.76258 type:complete len:267 (-) Transcript_29534:662-1462(-)